MLDCVFFSWVYLKLQYMTYISGVKHTVRGPELTHKEV